MLDGQLGMPEYKAIKEIYEKAIKALRTSLMPILQNATDYKKYLDFGFNLHANLDGVYFSKNGNQKLNPEFDIGLKISF